MLTLYGHPASPYALRVQLFLEELGLSYHYKPIALERGEHRREPYKTLNPFQRVPVVDHDGFVLAESNAILRYLSGRFEAWAWYPFNLHERAHVDQWMDYAGMQAGAPLSKLGWERFWLPKFNKPTDHLAVVEALAKIHRELPIIEARLSISRYLAAPSPTLADICFLPMLYYAELADFSLAAYPQLQAWYAAMQGRDTWQKIVAALDI